MRACRDCRWVAEQEQRVCHHPRSFKELADYYTGETFTDAASLAIMRNFGECGPEAKLFEAAEPP